MHAVYLDIKEPRSLVVCKRHTRLNLCGSCDFAKQLVSQQGRFMMALQVTLEAGGFVAAGVGARDITTLPFYEICSGHRFWPCIFVLARGSHRQRPPRHFWSLQL